MVRGRSVSRPRASLTSEEETLLRARLPRATYWVLGGEPPPTGVSDPLRRGGAVRPGRSGARPSSARISIPISRRPLHDIPLRLTGGAERGSPSGSRRPALMAQPLNFYGDPSTPRRASAPERRAGPCWDCLAEASTLVARGGDAEASAVLGSCRHWSAPAAPSHPPIRPSPRPSSPAVVSVPGISDLLLISALFISI